jgi:hypothetical protein
MDFLIRNMMHPQITIHSDDDDEVMSIDKHFRVPAMSGPSGPSLGTDLLINKRKVSSDVLSISSGHSSKQSSVSDDSDETGSIDAGSGGLYGGGARMFNTKRSMSSGSSSSSYETDETSEEDSMPNSPGVDVMANRMAAERYKVTNELNEKKEILYQMDRLEAKGYRLPKKFTLQSDIEEMRVEFNRILREKEVDASVRFQRKMMMALVTGVEYLNDRYDPFDVRLSGWSDTVHENINDYDDIFEELHDKYKGSGKKMAPELRLLMSLSGSAFMFHFTNRMLKQNEVPGVEEVLRSDPALMKQFQQSAMNRMASTTQAARGPGGGLFSMVGNLFGGFGGGSAPGRATMPMPSRQHEQVQMRRPQNVEDIIDDVSANISMNPTDSNRFETLSVSDEEITSIIEDTADMNGIMTGAKPQSRRGGRRVAVAGKRTLQL